MVKYILFLLLFIFSCSEEKVKTIDLSEITTSSKRYKEGKQKEKELKSEKNDSLPQIIEFLLDTLKINSSEIKKIQNSHFLDRFTTNVPTKLIFELKKDSVLLEYWTFKDTLQATNAFYNWLDFVKIELNEVSFYKKELFLMILDSNEIFKISNSKKIKVTEWTGYLLVSNPLFVIDNFQKNKLRWSYIKEGVISEFKKE